MDIKYIYDKCNELGINNYLYGDKLAPLDKAFGLDPKKRNIHGLDPYGVEDIFFGAYGILTYHKGNIHKDYKVFLGGSKLSRKDYMVATEEQEKAILDFYENLFAERKEQIARNGFFLSHIDDYLNKWLEVIRGFLKGQGKDVSVTLTEGCSQADPRVAKAFLFTKNGSQVGYIKVIVNSFGDIKLDVFNMCHTTYCIADFDNVVDYLKDACDWVC